MRPGRHRSPRAARLTQQRPDAVRCPAIDEADAARGNPCACEAPDVFDFVGSQQATGILRRQAAPRTSPGLSFKLQVSEEAHHREALSRGIDPDGFIVPGRHNAGNASKGQIREKVDNVAHVEPQNRQGVKANFVAFRQVLQSLKYAPRGLGRRGFLDVESLWRQRPQAVELFLKVGELRSQLDDGDAHDQRVISSPW